MCCPGGSGKDKMKRVECAGVTDYDRLESWMLQELRQNPVESNGTACDICRIIQIIHDYNITFGIHGDSLTGQMMNGFECTLWRRGYRVKTVQEDNGKEYSRKYTISSPLLANDVTLRLFVQYHIPHDLNTTEAPGNHPDVNAVMVAYGVHWSKYNKHKEIFGPDSYASNLRRLFAHLHSLAANHKLKLMIHRETFAQHFDGDGGDYWSARNDGHDLRKCVPLRPMTNNWREELVIDAAKKEGFSVVTSPTAQKKSENDNKPLLEVLPFFESTRPLHAYHPWLSNGERDCTHYCSVPALWWPFWRSWRLILDRRVASK